MVVDEAILKDDGVKFFPNPYSDVQYGDYKKLKPKQQKFYFRLINDQFLEMTSKWTDD